MSKFAELRRMRQKKLLNICSDELYEIFDPKIYLRETIEHTNQETVIDEKITQKNSKELSRKHSQAQKENARSFALLHRKTTTNFGSMDNPNCISNFIDDNQFSREAEFKPYKINGNALYDKNCVTCGNENYEVTFHKQRHICYQCRNHLKTPNNDIAIVYTSKEGNIMCYGVKIDHLGAKTHYKTSYNDQKIFGYKCYATFSGPDELIQLLDDEQPTND